MEPMQQRRLLTRRDLFLRAGALTAAATLTDLIASGDAHAEEQAPKLILGSGSLRYECIHDWLTPPDTHKYGDTQGICQDSKGNFYVTHTVGQGSQSQDAVYVFDKKGQFTRSFNAGIVKGGGHGIEARKEGSKEFLYHCDTSGRQVIKTDLLGTEVWKRDTKMLQEETGYYKDGKPFVPTNIAFAPNGDFYIAEGYGSDYIHQYTATGTYIRTFGGRGTGSGKLNVAHGIGLDTRGGEPMLIITERSNGRSQRFTLDGQPAGYVDGMRQPCHFGFHQNLMAVPDLSSVVTLFDEKGKVAAQLGDGAGVPGLRGKPKTDFIPGKFVHPHGILSLKNGDILVAEWLPQGRMTLLKKQK
jgi:hypothetical protein